METINISSERVNKLKRKCKVIGDIAIASAMSQIGDQTTLSVSLGVGLVQGLKYNGNLKRGIKAGLVTMAVFAGGNVIMNVARNWDIIKKA